MADSIIIHSDEICLKGGNRGFFEKRLLENVRRRLDRIGGFSYLKRQGSVYAYHDGDMDEGRVREVTDALKTVFGVACFIVGSRCEASMDAMGELAVGMMKEAGPSVFRVTARRSDKTFPVDSQEIARVIGGRILAEVRGVSVNLTEYETDVRVEVSKDGAFVGIGRHDGFGGLPTGSSGRVVSLLSGGIDSPLATWKVMRRGCRAVLLHFHSYPYVGRDSVEKVKRLAGILDRYQLDTTLHLAPFAEVQSEIVSKAAPALRVVLYRRMMLRIAEMVARRERALAIVNGDAAGQVSSQTLENIATISAAASMPLLRPLIGENKNGIVDAARRIGTYEISIEPHDDCCSMFMPKSPATKSMIAQAEAEEAKMDCARLAKQVMEGIETVKYGIKAG